jgi:anthranilate synthase component 1
MALSRSIGACPDPVALYADACDGGRRADTLLLESADQSTKSGERSLIMTRAALRIAGRGGEVRIEALGDNGRSALSWLAGKLARHAAIEPGRDSLVARFSRPPQGSERQRLLAPSVLDAVRSMLDLTVHGEPALAPLCAGSLSYDLLGAYETLPEAERDPLGWPDFELYFAEELVWIQHATRRTLVLAYVFGGEHGERAYHDAIRGLAERVERAASLAPMTPVDPARAAPRASPDLDDAAFARLVERLKQHIVAGDVFQIVPSRAFCAPCPDPLVAYRRLRVLNPSPYMFFLHGRAGVLFGASPESALQVKGEPKRVTINPIAGTRPRGRAADGSIDRDLDGRLEAELRLDQKEIAEHMMLVDLARNDVARVSRPGSRRVDRLLEVVRYSHVMHLVSLVSGELANGLDALHAYVATMNMGTLVGAPKLKAAELLRLHEPSRRGPYGGAVGYLTSAGELDSCIVIRSAVVKEGVAQVRAGCGVVYDSDPDAEAQETLRKAQAVLLALAEDAP